MSLVGAWHSEGASKARIMPRNYFLIVFVVRSSWSLKVISVFCRPSQFLDFGLEFWFRYFKGFCEQLL
jgi:hypothetical protein